jgi:hypothetical protein
LTTTRTFYFRLFRGDKKLAARKKAYIKSVQCQYLDSSVGGGA